MSNSGSNAKPTMSPAGGAGSEDNPQWSSDEEEKDLGQGCPRTQDWRRWRCNMGWKDNPNVSWTVCCCIFGGCANFLDQSNEIKAERISSKSNFSTLLYILLYKYHVLYTNENDVIIPAF